VDWRTGRIARSYHISGWSQFPLGEWLAGISGLPVFVENDANTAALAEAVHGGGKGANPVLWVNSGSGVGGGLVIDGEIYHGAAPTEMEIGHLRLERDGTIVEDRCSGWSLDRRVREAVAKHPESVLAAQLQAETSGPETRHLGAALAAGDPVAEGILDDAMRELAFALSHAVHLLHPEVIVVGGGVALLGEPLRERLAKHLPGFLMDALQPGPRVVLSPLMENAVPLGALTVAARRLGA
jgi:glucokinase